VIVSGEVTMDSDKKKDQPGVYNGYPPDQCPYDNCGRKFITVVKTIATKPQLLLTG